MRIAVVSNEHELIESCRVVADLRPHIYVEAEVVSPWEVRDLVERGDVDCLVYASDTLRAQFALARHLGDCTTCADAPRSIVVARNLCPATVYGLLAFGVDDVVELTDDVESFARDLADAVDARRLVCASHLVGGVLPPPPLVGRRIVSRDPVDEAIVELVAAGYTDREIAEVMHYSHQSIRNKLSRILMESGLRNRTQLAALQIYTRDSEADPSSELVTA